MKKTIILAGLVFLITLFIVIDISAKTTYVVEPQVSIESRKSDLQMVVESYERIITSYQDILTQRNFAADTDQLDAIENRLKKIESKIDSMSEKIDRISEKLNIQPPSAKPQVPKPSKISEIKKP